MVRGGRGSVRLTADEQAELVSAADVKPTREPSKTLNQSRFAKTHIIDHKLVQRINEGNFADISRSEVRSLFELLDEDGSGGLGVDELQAFLQDVMDPPCPQGAVEELYNLVADTGGGKIGSDHLFGALTIGPLRRLLHDPHREELLRQKKLAERQITHVKRKFMLDRFEWRASRDDAFLTLPVVILFCLSFILLVISHIQLKDRSRMSRAVEDHIAGWAKSYTGPYHELHVPNLDYVYKWLTEAGAHLAFDYCDPDIVKSTRPEFCELAPRTALIADMKVMIRSLDGDEDSLWLLHSVKDQVPQGSSLLETGKFALQEMRRTKFFKRDTELISLMFAGYNSAAKMFTLTDVQTRIDRYGLAIYAQFTYSFPSSLYESYFLLPLDALFLVMCLYPMKTEIRDLSSEIRIRGIRHGFQMYMGHSIQGFWNVVDWINILLGLALCVAWCTCVSITTTGFSRTFLTDELELKSDIMSVSKDQLDALIDELSSLYAVYRCLRFLASATMMAIMLKFLKAFESNARLQVATKTMRKCINDLVHFMVVFGAVFLSYAITGHVLFGGDLIEFKSFDESCNTCFLALLGEVSWYAALANRLEPLSSEIPFTLVACWFWTYNVVAVLILLNMLLAIIMGNYDLVIDELNNMPDAPTIVQQTFRFFQRRSLHKKGGWPPLSSILASLKDKKNPAHPKELVDAESLQEAFPFMKVDQVEFLMKWLLKDQDTTKKLHYEDSELQESVNGSVQLLWAVASVIHEVSLGVMKCTDALGPSDATSKRPSTDLNQIQQILNSKSCDFKDTPGQITVPERINAQDGGLTAKLDEQGALLSQLSQQMLSLQAQVSIICSPTQQPNGVFEINGVTEKTCWQMKPAATIIMPPCSGLCSASDAEKSSLDRLRKGVECLPQRQ